MLEETEGDGVRRVSESEDHGLLPTGLPTPSLDTSLSKSRLVSILQHLPEPPRTRRPLAPVSIRMTTVRPGQAPALAGNTASLAGS